MKKLSSFFYDISSKWITLMGLVIFLVFSVLTLPAQNDRTNFYSHGLGSPDTSLVYSEQQLIKMAETYGEEGRAAYIQARWSFDLVFPLVYTFFLITSISFLFIKGSLKGSRLSRLNLVPLGALIFDLGENIATSLVMAAYPVKNLVGQFLAILFTPLKWLFFTLSVLLLLIGLVNILVRCIKKR